MRVVLATSPHVRHPMVLQNDFEVHSSSMLTFVPVGLLSLISTVRTSPDIDPILFDLNRAITRGMIELGPNFYRNVAARVSLETPDAVGFMTENESYHHVLQICNEIKKLIPKCKTILGGPHASAVGPATLCSWPAIDYIVKGEGELTFPELLENIANGLNEPVRGVWNRDRDGALQFGGERPLIEHLDSLSYPAFDLYSPEHEEEIYFEVGRGCPFRCTFCSTAPFWGRKHRVKSSARIIEELKYVSEMYGQRRMHFTHDLFTTDKRWVQEVCHVLIDSDLRLDWTCSSRTDTVTPELLELMASAGCSAIYFGFESGSERILTAMKKRIELSRSYAILRKCIELGIAPNVGFIGGFPGEDLQSLADTFGAYSKSIQLGGSPVYIFQYTPFEDSSILPTLSDRICTGHFVDLPLEPNLDAANRALIASDPIVFGAYHRPRQNKEIEENLIDGLEEFATLVSVAPIPTLAIAEAIGSTFSLYQRWVEYIGSLNRSRHAATFRQYFGTPVQYCDFLIDQTMKPMVNVDGVASMLKIIRTNHSVAASEHLTRATTMATYRTGLAAENWTPIELSTTLSVGDIVASLMLSEDVEQLLTSKPGRDPLPSPEDAPMFLLWQRLAPGEIQLLRVDAFTYHVVSELRNSSRDAATILADWVSRQGSTRTDLFSLIQELETATRSGLVHAPEI